MTLLIEYMVKQINPEKTTLLFGAGASIPSGAPSVADLMADFSQALGVDSNGYSFAEFCSLYEIQKSRVELVSAVRKRLLNIRPSGGLLNIAEIPWRSIYTTNYDDLVEQCFMKKKKLFKRFSSNFDFDGSTPPGATPLFKLHGTIENDISSGHKSRLILTTEDNDLVEEFREKLFDRLKCDLAECDLVIIGHSLSDPDIREIINRAIKLKKASHSTQNIYLLIYTADPNRAQLFENQGLKVVFGGVDDFFLELSKSGPAEAIFYQDNDILANFPAITPTTFDIAIESSKPSQRFDAIYSGSPSDYPAIRAGLTFDRSSRHVYKQELESGKQFLSIIGASGVGKTTLARQIALSLVDSGFFGWEHHSNRPFISESWRSLAGELKKRGQYGVLVLDDAHAYLPEVNSLVDLLVADDNVSLKLILTSSNNHWKPRLKSSNLSRFGTHAILSQLDQIEITNLLNLVQNRSEIAKLVDRSFRGFTVAERKRRLTERCNRDFFVCLKNIFANDRFDLIVLKEYAAIPLDFQRVYKFICALESLGVVVHRQIVIRMLNIPAQQLGQILDNLEGLVEEFAIDRKQGIYGWRGRHPVISNIITDHKFSDPADILKLLRALVKSISPSYDVEVTTIRQLWSSDTGIRRVPELDDQNELLRMMISAAPSERVPRHRLINNLIRQGAFTDAETEIRVFEADLRVDGPVRRYKVRLLLERAVSEMGLMLEDKAKLLNDAHSASVRLLEQDSFHTQNLKLYSDVCLEIYKATGDYEYLDAVRMAIKHAENETSDPELTQLLVSFETRLTRTSDITGELTTVLVEPEIEPEVIDTE